MTCKQKFCIFLPKKIVFSSPCFSFLLLWARRKKKNLLSMLTLGFAFGEKNPQGRAYLNSQGWAASPGENSCPYLSPPVSDFCTALGSSLTLQKGGGIPGKASPIRITSSFLQFFCPHWADFPSSVPLLCQLNPPWFPTVPSLLSWAKQRIMLHCKKWVTRKIGKKNNKDNSTISFHL